MRTGKALAAAFALSLASLMITGTAPAQSDTTGKVTLESTAVAIGIGVTWGEGTLLYRGQQHKFTVKGLDVLDLGISKVNAEGQVTGLKNVEDLDGTYVTAAAGAAVGGGAGVAALQNQNGVQMALTATGQGVRLTAAKAGVEINLKNRCLRRSASRDEERRSEQER
jgi:hypothetical protein